MDFDAEAAGRVGRAVEGMLRLGYEWCCVLCGATAVAAAEDALPGGAAEGVFAEPAGCASDRLLQLWRLAERAEPLHCLPPQTA